MARTASFTGSTRHQQTGVECTERVRLISGHQESHARTTSPAKAEESGCVCEAVLQVFTVPKSRREAAEAITKDVSLVQQSQA